MAAGFRLVNGNDGGVAFSDNAASPDAGTTSTVAWSQDDERLQLTQTYSADKRPGVSTGYTTGLQDNGTWTATAGGTAGPHGVRARHRRRRLRTMERPTARSARLALLQRHLALHNGGVSFARATRSHRGRQ